MADIPGIIEGASEGKGLGLRFLRHIERNAVLLFMVPATSKDIRAEYEILLGELEKYNPELLTKARVLAVSKMDLPRLDEETGEELPAPDAKKLSKQLGIPVVCISSHTREGIDELKDLLWIELNKEQSQPVSQILAGKSIVVSGVFTVPRDNIKELVERNGGKNVSSISKNTSFVLAGEKMGPEKRKKAESLGIPIVSEAEFREMIR